MGMYGKSVMSIIFLLGFWRWMFAMHASIHSKSECPWCYKIFYAIFYGFTPFPMVWSDVHYVHCGSRIAHHKQKETIDKNKENDDSKWSELPLLTACFRLFLHPSHTSGIDITMQWFTYPTHIWPERIVVGAIYWAQLYALVILDPTLMLLSWVLALGHVGSVTTWLLFHGVTHRLSFYACLFALDSSGMRQVPYFEKVFHILLTPEGWLEAKFHDVHHAFSTWVGAISGRVTLCGDWRKVEEALANLVDEGLFLDSKGAPISPLAYAGHKIGTRRTLQSRGTASPTTQSPKKKENEEYADEQMADIDEKKGM